MGILSFHVAGRRKYKAKRGSDYRFAHKGETFPYRNHEASWREAPVCKRLVIKLAPKWTKKSLTYMCHVVTPCQVSRFSGEFWIYGDLKTEILLTKCFQIAHGSLPPPPCCARDLSCVF